MTTPLFLARGLTKTYRLGEARIPALRGVDLAIAPGSLVALAGPSGSGKSTLLNLLGLLDEPDAGTLLFSGREVQALPEREKTLLRRRHLGFVFQSFHLLPVLSARENVEYPLAIAGVGRRERRTRATEALSAVGLGDRLDHPPDRLSGGERQRVAIARAIVHGPAAILADEPTGNLDSQTTKSIVDLLFALNRDRATTLIFATHDPELFARAPRRLRLADGRIVADEDAGGGG
jgi:putative ABC transport system ATP-binding protein